MSKTYRTARKYNSKTPIKARYEKSYYKEYSRFIRETGIKDYENKIWNYFMERSVYFSHDYSNSPSWWNNIKFHRPNRRKNKKILDNIRKGIDDPDDVSYTLNSKGCPYYW